jgi:hypothetical protein
MKRFIINMAILLTAAAANGQTGKPDQPFFFIGANILYKLVITPDTLGIYRCSSYSVHSDTKAEYLYKILGSEQEGDYRLYFVEALFQLEAPHQSLQKFQSIFLKYSADGGTASLLAEGDAYETLAESKKHVVADPGSKFFITYFSTQKLQSFASYRKIGDLDSAATEDLFLAYKEGIESNKQKITNTHTPDTYGSLVGRELMTRAMIGLKVNPFAPEEEITKKAKTSAVARKMNGS